MKRVAYVLSGFPKISETFVLNEIRWVREFGWEPLIFPFDVFRGGIEHPGMEEIWPYVRSIGVEPGWRSVAPLVAGALRNRPGWLRTHRWAKEAGGMYPWLHRALASASLTLRNARCDWLHVHFGGPAFRNAVLLAKDANLPLSVTLHRFDIFDRPLPDLAELVRQADVCVTVSEYNRRYLVDSVGIPASKIRVIANAVDTQRFAPDPAVEKIPGRILTVARLAEEKGLFYLLEAVARLVSAGHACEWLIVGEGPERSHLEHTIRERGLEHHVRLLGACGADEVVRQLREAEIFALPSLSESAGVVNLEAMAVGIPVVATEVMGVPEYVTDGEVGRLVPPGSTEGLEQAVCELMMAPSWRATLGKAGRERVVKRFGHNAQAQALTQLWEEQGARLQQ